MASGIDKIISWFFGNNISPKTKLLFGRWFRLNDSMEEMEATMSQLWENSPSTMTNETVEDLEKIREKIFNNKQVNKQYFQLKRILQFAAVVVVIITSTVFVTYFVLDPKPIEYAQLSVNFGKSQEIKLADGTVVTANAGSTVIYPEDFSQTDTRTVFLTGEASFKVAKNPDKPFIVKTKYMSVTALGTYFNIKTYPNEDLVRTTLIEGSVNVLILDSTRHEFILKPNEQIIYSTLNAKTEIKTVDAAKLATWENGFLVFQGVDFEEISNTIERKYNVTINYDNNKMQKYKSYFVKFSPDESIENVMNILSKLIENSSYRIEGKNIYFYSN